MNKILSNVVIHKDYSKDIVRILKSNRSDEVIRKKLSKYHENDIADAVKLLDKDTRIRLYKILGVEWTAEVFSYLEDTRKSEEGILTGELFYAVRRLGIMYSRRMHMKTRLTGQQRI